MPSKTNTPQFNEAISKILDNLQEHDRVCKECSKTFHIFDEDIVFYKKFLVPPPMLCPNCRKQRRMAFSNYTHLFKKKCDVPGHNEMIVSPFPPVSGHGIFYDNDYWSSDKFDSLDFGKEYSENEKFFAQFKDLILTVPHRISTRDPKSVNCEYTASGMGSKNCYYNFGALNSEYIYYAVWPIDSRDSIDILQSEGSELCYENVLNHQCYNCNFAYLCHECMDSSFMYDCYNCTNCFGGVNLHNKSYYFFNQPMTKKDYEEKISKIDLGSRKTLDFYKKKFAELMKNSIFREGWNENVQNCIGNLLDSCKNVFYGFLITDSEDVRYVDVGIKSRDLVDVTLFGYNTNNSHESSAIINSAYVNFSIGIRDSTYLEYCLWCSGCQNCFGCIGLVSKKYCIFNKQYSEEEYWQIVDKIKTKMLQDKEYGEFFPIGFSLYPYNASFANVEFPLDKNEALKIGAWWYDEPEIKIAGIELLKSNEVPDNIKDVSDDILEKAIICEVSGKPFRVVKYELDFYRRKHLPIPTKSPYTRILERFKMMPLFYLWESTCFKCGKKINTSHDPKKKLRVYCKECYLKEVY